MARGQTDNKACRASSGKGGGLASAATRERSVECHPFHQPCEVPQLKAWISSRFSALPSEFASLKGQIEHLPGRLVSARWSAVPATSPAKRLKPHLETLMVYRLSPRKFFTQNDLYE